MNLINLYNIMPVALQNCACSMKGYYIKKTRYNKNFWRMLEEFEARRKWSYQELCDFRDEHLRKIIQHSYETVPFYNETFKKLRLTPRDIKYIEDLEKLPVITKQLINSNPKRFYSNKINQYKVLHLHTSGTTGAGFHFLSTMDTIHAQWAATWRHYQYLGAKYGLWRATFSGQRIVNPQKEQPPFWRIIYPDHRIYFSSYHENDKNLKYYYEEIKKRRISWICGYPSLIHLLANFMIRNHLSLRGIVQYITTSAECLLDYQKEAIRQAFGVEPHQLYGQSENVAIFTDDRLGNLYVNEDFSAVEFKKNQTNSYDVIGTNLWNYAMPLIRYETKDTVEVDKSIYKNGRKIISIDGRKEDYLSLPDGTKIGRMDYTFKDAIHVCEAQIYQKKDYSIIVYCVVSKGFNKKEEDMIRAILDESLHKQVKITFQYVDRIERGNGEKLRFIKSEIR